MKQRLIYLLSILFTIAVILGILILNRKVFAKQEPIQEILNQIQLNEAELQQIESRADELNKANQAAKEKLLNEYGLQISESKVEEVVDEERTPGKLNASGDAQEMPQIEGTDEHEKFKALATAYGLDASQIRAVENHYGIKEGVILCITVAETSGGNRGYGGKNIGSVGSNDRGDRPTYALMESGLEAIGKTLTNKYLGKKQTLGCLSNAGSCIEKNDNGSRYATSNGNRERNMTACLSTIYGSINASEFSIRR